MFLLDCCLSLSMLTINALAAAYEFLISIQVHYLSIKGLEQLIRTVSNMKRKINPRLKITGILITMTYMRTTYLREITEMLHKAYDTQLRMLLKFCRLSFVWHSFRH